MFLGYFARGLGAHQRADGGTAQEGARGLGRGSDAEVSIASL